MRPAAISSGAARPGSRGARPQHPFERTLAAARQGIRPRDAAGAARPAAGRQATGRGGAAEEAGAGVDGQARAACGAGFTAVVAPPAVEGAAALRAAVRALPPAIVASSVGNGTVGTQLTMSFGALGVELRAGAQGLEVALQPSATLADAARAELPGLVAALRARGIQVARAEVRPRGHPGPPPRHAR